MTNINRQMMKTIASKIDLVAKKAHDDIDRKLDAAVHNMRLHCVEPMDVAMTDNVFRPFCHTVEIAQHNGTDPEVAIRAVLSVCANMISETLVRTVPRDEPAKAGATAQLMLNMMADFLNENIAVNYPASASVTTQ